MQLTATSADIGWRTVLQSQETAIVESVFRRALNLRLGSGELLTIFPSGSPDSPGGLIASHSGGDTLARVGELATLNKRFVTLGRTQITLDECRYVTNSLEGRTFRSPSSKRLAEFEMHLMANAQLGSFYGPLKYDAFNTALVERLSRAREQLVVVVHEKAIAKIPVATAQLIGLGIGLTPSGDDYLLGHLIVLDHSSIASTPVAHSLRQAISQNLASTTSVSQAYLSAALNHQYSQPLRSLLEAVSEEKGALLPQLQSALNHGATSGQDTCTGMLDAWQLLRHENN